MLKTIRILRDPFDYQTWETYEVEDTLAFLKEQFEVFPEGARIFHTQVCDAYDITPKTEEDIERLKNQEGLIYVVLFPKGFVPPIVWIGAAIITAIVGAAILLPKLIKMPSINTDRTSLSPKSSNNELSNRVNTARPLGRIPDIFGTVRSTPDLLALPFTTYIDNVEVEHCYMCIGRGEYLIHDIRDGETPLQNIDLAWARIFGPHTSPNYHSENCIQVNEARNDEYVFGVERCNAVNGQKLSRGDGSGPGNSSTVVGNNNIDFICPNRIHSDAFNFDQIFVAGQTISVSGSYGDPNKQQTYRNMSVRVPYKAGLLANLKVDLIDTTGIPQGFDKGSWITLSFKDNYAKKLDGRYFVQSVQIVNETDDLSGARGTFAYLGFTIDTGSAPGALDDWIDVGKKTGWMLCDMICDYMEVGTHISFDGVYKIQSVSAHDIILNRPELQNPAWATGPDAYGTSAVLFGSAYASRGKEGPYILASKQVDHFIINIVSPNDYYAAGPNPADQGKTTDRRALQTQLTVKWYEVLADNEVGNELGSETISYSGNGDGTFCGRSYVFKVARPCQIAVSVANNYPDYDQDSPELQGWILQQEVKWRDLYGFEKNFEHDPGDITTVQVTTYATQGALAVKERKLNLLVTRKIPELTGASYNIDGEKVATRDAASIIAFLCKDPLIGDMDDNIIDFENIRSTVDVAAGYFGNAAFKEFCYTFDSGNMSLEESIQVVANAVFCNCYRQLGKIKMNFEQKNSNNTMIFTPDNKVLNSETRTITFGNQGGYDGVEVKYVDPDNNDALVSYYIPSDRSAKFPKKIETVGVRSEAQAYVHAWRAWQKIQYQCLTAEFTATQEAELVMPYDRILCGDSTNWMYLTLSTTASGDPGFHGSEIFEQEGTLITLTQPQTNQSTNMDGMYIQLPDGKVERFSVKSYTNSNGTKSRHKFYIYPTPRLPLITVNANPDAAVKSQAMPIPRAGDKYNHMSTNLMAIEKTPNDDLTVGIKAVNYDDRYYTYDKKWTGDMLPPPIGKELPYIGGKPEDPDDPDNPTYPNPQDPNLAIWPFTPDNTRTAVTTAGKSYNAQPEGDVMRTFFMDDTFVRANFGGIADPKYGVCLADPAVHGETIWIKVNALQGDIAPSFGWFIGVEFEADWIQDWATATQRDRSIRVEVGIIDACILYVNGVTVNGSRYPGPQVFYGGPGVFADTVPDGTPRCYYDSARRMLVRKGKNTVAFCIGSNVAQFPSKYGLPNDAYGEMAKLGCVGFHCRILRDDGSEVVLYKTESGNLGRLVLGAGPATLPYLP